MKKIFFAIFIMALLFQFTGCTKNTTVKDEGTIKEIPAKEITKSATETPKEMEPANIVNKKPDTAKSGKGNITALTRAAAGGHTKIARQLIERGSDIDQALEGCQQLKGKRQTKCIKILGTLKEERDNRSQPVKSKYVRPASAVPDDK